MNGGIWRRHTRLLDAEGRVSETTVPREVYFGNMLGPVESQRSVQMVR